MVEVAGTMCEPSACPPSAPESRTREAWRSAERFGERHGYSGSGVRSPGCQLRRPDIHITCSASRRTKASLSTRIRGRTRSRPHECASARLILLYGRPGLFRIQRRRQVPARSGPPSRQAQCDRPTSTVPQRISCRRQHAPDGDAPRNAADLEPRRDGSDRNSLGEGSRLISAHSSTLCIPLLPAPVG